MKVKMHTLYAGPSGHCHPDHEIDLPEAEANALIVGHYASPVSHIAAKAEVKAHVKYDDGDAETSAIDTAETAAANPAFKRKGNRG